MAKASLSLIVPDFAVLFANELNHAMLPASVKTLIHKAAFEPDSRGLYHHLLCLFSNDEKRAVADLPMARLRGGSELSLCADPCYLHPDRDKLLMFYQDLDLSMQEAQALATFLQPLFDDMQATLHVQTPTQWLVELKQPVQASFYSKEGLNAQPVTDFLPQGAEAESWIRLWNEIQMLLFDCPINQAREAAGKVAINSVWFWGYEDFPQNWQPWSQVSGQDQVLQRLVIESQSPYQAQLRHFSDIEGKQCLHVNAFDADKSWQQQLDLLADNWLSPAMAALKTWQLNELMLIVPEWGCYRLTPFSMWRFW